MVVEIMVPFLDPYYNTAPFFTSGTHKGTIILTTAHMYVRMIAESNVGGKAFKP